MADREELFEIEPKCGLVPLPIGLTADDLLVEIFDLASLDNISHPLVAPEDTPYN